MPFQARSIPPSSAVFPFSGTIQHYTGHQYAAVKLPEDAGRLLNSVRWYRSQLSNTMKNGRDPETHKVLDVLREVEPLKVTLDPAACYPEQQGE